MRLPVLLSSISAFKFIRLDPNKVHNVHNPSRLKLRLGLSHLRAHKFKHNFSDCLDELCISGTNIDSMKSFPLPLSSICIRMTNPYGESL